MGCEWQQNQIPFLLISGHSLQFFFLSLSIGCYHRHRRWHRCCRYYIRLVQCLWVYAAWNCEQRLFRTVKAIVLFVDMSVDRGMKKGTHWKQLERAGRKNVVRAKLKPIEIWFPVQEKKTYAHTHRVNKLYFSIHRTNFGRTEKSKSSLYFT